MEDLLRQISECVITGEASGVEKLISDALSRGVDPKTLMDKGLVAGMAVIGRRFKNDEIYLPEVMIAARAMNAGLKVLDPALQNASAEPKGTLVLGTVHGDLHDVGKNMVSMMFRGAGFKVVDLGIDVPAKKFVESVKENLPEIVGLSALLSTTMPAMKSTVEAIKDAGLNEHTIVMVGGAPVTQKFAEEIGADGWAPDAASAVEVAMALMGERKIKV